VGVGLLAGALFIFGIALAPPSGAAAGVTVVRHAGTTRYGTAQDIASDSAFATPAGAIVATGENFPDALAASALAGSKSPAPIILTQTATYTAEAKSALGALKGKGVTAVTVVGGTAAVSDSVKNAIAADGFTVTRTAGTDRYETAAAIATAAGTPGTVGSDKTALIATGENFPDALAGGPAAYAKGLPILLVHRDSIPAATSSALSSLGIKHAVILGGTAVVSDAVKSQLDTATGTASERLAGINRYGTAAAVGTWEKGTLGFAVNAVIDATGNNFPDALAAGPLGGELGAPIVLSASCPQETVDFLKSVAASVATLFLSGGTAVIDQATQDCLVAALGGAANANKTVTARPELVSAKILSTADNTQATGSDLNTQIPEGTVVEFDFDETIVNPICGDFIVYNSTSSSSFSGDDCDVDSNDDSMVRVLFASLTKTDSSTNGTANLVLAANTEGAVQDNNNPQLNATEGSAPLASNGNGAGAAAGGTAGPDLLTVGRFGAVNTDFFNADQAAVDFTFDENADVDGGNFHLVSKQGEDVICDQNGTDVTDNASGGSVPGGSGTKVITVICGPYLNNTGVTDQPDTKPTLDNTARGYVETDSVVDSTGNQNPVEASNTPHASSTVPDLTGLTLKVSESTRDTAIFTFDQTLVNEDFNEGDFTFYTETGCEWSFNNAAGEAELNPSGDKQLAVYVPGGWFESNPICNGGGATVGASVAAGAVTATASPNTDKTNETDEMGAIAPAGAANQAGVTNGPDLTAVALAAGPGTFSDVEVGAYLFDENVLAGSEDGDASDFHLYEGNGDRLTCQSINSNTDAGFEAAPDNAVVCAAYTFDGEGQHNPGVATNAEIKSAVLGTVEEGAVTDSGGNVNPIGAKPTAGGNGSAQA